MNSYLLILLCATLVALFIIFIWAAFQSDKYSVNIEPKYKK